MIKPFLILILIGLSIWCGLLWSAPTFTESTGKVPSSAYIGKIQQKDWALYCSYGVGPEASKSFWLSPSSMTEDYAVEELKGLLR